MKTIRQAIIGAVALLLASAVHSFAIEDIHVSVQSSNVVLSWPSATNETYLVQSLQALGTTDTWLTLTDGFPATLNTNLTVFVETNGVQPTIWTTNTSGGGTNSGGMIPPGGGTNGSDVFGSSASFYRVVRDGVHLWGLTNGMVVHDVLETAIEFSVDTTDQIVGVTFYDTNQNPVIGARATPGPGGGWGLIWNTTLIANGNYAIEAELDFANTNPVISVPVTVTVSNLFSFPNYLTQEYGSQMWLYGQTLPDADVEIDIYDENTNYLGSFYPVSDDNGIISFTWDLTDGEGDTFNDTNFWGVWTVEDAPSVVSQSANVKTVNSSAPNFLAPTTKETLVRKIKPAGATPDAGSGGSAVTLWSQEPSWTPNNNWVVAYGSLTGGDPADQTAPETIIGGNVSYTQYYGILGTLYDMPGHNVSPGNSAVSGTVFTLNNSTSRSNLLVYLASPSPLGSPTPRAENFFYMGHGTESSISAYNGSGTTITADQISFALGNTPLSYSGDPQFDQWIDPDLPTMEPTSYPPDIRTAALHVYRFVWIEACDTAGGEFSESFGIPAQDLSTNNFIASGLKSRAYLGYKNEVGFDADYDGNWPQESEMWAIFLSNWLNGSYSLAALVYFAQNNTGPFAGNVSGTYYEMDPSATSYGATDLIYPNPW